MDWDLLTIVFPTFIFKRLALLWIPLEPRYLDFLQNVLKCGFLLRLTGLKSLGPLEPPFFWIAITSATFRAVSGE